MRKAIYNSILAAALVALVLTSCTDEADVLDNTPIKNKKTLTQPTIERPYPGYEETDMSSADVIQLVSDFNNAMSGESEATTMDITNALLAMETFFNYGVVAKQEIVDTTSYYTGSNFQFEVNLDAQGNIDGAELVDAYTTFLNNFLQQMNGKYLQLSDLFVKAVGNGKVMFALEIPTFTVYDRIIWEPHKCKILNSSVGPFDIPDGSSINLTNLLNQYGNDFDLEKLSELCSTYEIGFIYGIQPQLYAKEGNTLIYSLGGGVPLVYDKYDMFSIVSNAIQKSWGLYPTNDQNLNDDIKIVDLLISCHMSEIQGVSNVYAYVTKKRYGNYYFNPDWDILDNIMFTTIN